MLMADAPRLFISYCWSTPEHEAWVINLATELVTSGVDVILDKWDLREGHDSIAFMEKMVTDPTIKKVALICDEIYAAKADGRQGGVGTETQIISAEVYAQQAQDKFVAVVTEKDSNGKPYVPTYYKSRIHIDLSISEKYSENFEKLLRWVFDKPLHVRPEIGKVPQYIADPDTLSLGTAVPMRRLVEGIKDSKPYMAGALDEYLTLFAANLERFRITTEGHEGDDSVIASIEKFLPSRNEFIQIIATLARYTNLATHMERILKFFEDLIPYLSRPEDIQSWRETDFDNFRYAIHEMFLYTIALFLKAEQLDAAHTLLSSQYYSEVRANKGLAATVDFVVFHEHARSFEIRNQRLDLRRVSLRADFIERQSGSSGLQFKYLMQADFVCYLYSYFNKTGRWWPETLLYATDSYGAFELFGRAISSRYLTKVLNLLSVADLVTFRTGLVDIAADGGNLLPRGMFNYIDVGLLSGIKYMGTKP